MGKGDLTPHLLQHQRKRMVNLPAVIADISGGDRIFRPRMSQALADWFALAQAVYVLRGNTQHPRHICL